ncbi:hypothetical protein THAOC_05329 [Thalassiosira oceanica]|uniref:Uncharacterized protein n=1 Tax=Thalassiosira oceanica TaxID=159749 RepID=K0T5W2_THAOC|nr:hypothetical protein THAOC_05329 [Thalassiosira oceanica]|eukprot:EJK73070.1 hypothetical protein THAOC_05329 [Thalassiosira oceanica]
MLHQQNRQNDRGPDEATTEGLGPWNRVASGPESSSTESSDLAMGDAVSQKLLSRLKFNAIHLAPLKQVMQAAESSGKVAKENSPSHLSPSTPQTPCSLTEMAVYTRTS